MATTKTPSAGGSVFRIVPYFLHHAQIVVGRPGEPFRVDGVVDVVKADYFLISFNLIFFLSAIS